MFADPTKKFDYAFFKQLLQLYKKTSLFMEWQTELLVIIYKDWF